MNCQKCGTLNNEGSKFCMKCGSELIRQVSQPASPSTIPVQNTVTGQTPVNMVENPTIAQGPVNPVPQAIPVQTNPIPNTVIQNNPVGTTVTVTPNNPTVSNMTTTQNISGVGSLHYFSYMLSFIIKPFETFKKEKSKLENTKTALILSAIVAGIMMILNLIKSMISVVYVKHISWFSETTYSWEWSNLKEVNYVSLIFKNFLIYVAIFAAIAGLFYIVSLIVKKKIKFQEFLSITASAIIPVVICGMFFATILEFIYAPLALIVSILGCIYTFIIFHELINYRLELEGNQKIYVNTICYGIIVCAVYFIFVAIVSAAAKSGLTDIFGLMQ